MSNRFTNFGHAFTYVAEYLRERFNLDHRESHRCCVAAIRSHPDLEHHELCNLQGKEDLMRCWKPPTDTLPVATAADGLRFFSENCWRF